MSVPLNLSSCWRFAYSPRFLFSLTCFCLFTFVWPLPACHNFCDCVLASSCISDSPECSVSFSPPCQLCFLGVFKCISRRCVSLILFLFFHFCARCFFLSFVRCLIYSIAFEGWGPQYKMNHFRCDFFFLSAFFKKISSVIKIILVWFVLLVFLALRTQRWVNFCELRQSSI